jgi:carbamoyl-phosphate synthase large subunit
MKYRVLLEASGSLTSHYLIKSVQDAGAFAIPSDIDNCAARYVGNDFAIVPKSDDPNLWKNLEKIILKKKINVIIPSFDETLIEWSKQKNYYIKKGVYIIISDEKVLKICQDKWQTFKFFKKIGIPTPNTSLKYIYPLVKPRNGRGGKGILINEDVSSMKGMISQEILTGKEYTIDVFCDNQYCPVYIVPRIRLNIVDGKSTAGITIKHDKIVDYVKKICSELKFIGPINFQCFENEFGQINFLEINPRIAGGMALGFESTENWITLIFKNLIELKKIKSKEVNYNLKMYRYYNELFIK